MALLGRAAMLLSFDVAAEVVAEHDDWHTHEHLPERLAIPGFLRGTRWVAVQGRPRYLVLYEVATLATLSSAAYLQRLNQPSPWTTKLMAHYQGMRRGFCTVSASFGFGCAQAALLVRFKPAAEADVPLRRWLGTQALAALPSRPGLCGAHLLEGAATPAMTNEQRLRGADAGVDWAVLATGFRADALAELAGAGLDARSLADQGAMQVEHAVYRIDCSLCAGEVPA